MSKYNNGILGPFSGRVGNVVGAKWKDQFVMRARPYKKEETQATTRQVVQRNRFKLMSETLRPLAGAINLGYKWDARLKGMTVRNVAMKENMENAMTLSGGSWILNELNLMVARGNFGNVNTITAAYSNNMMSLAWQNDAGAIIGILPSGTNVDLADNDIVHVVFWNKTKNEAIYNKFSTAHRDDQALSQAKPTSWVAANDVYAFVFVLATDVDTYLSGNVTPQVAARAEEMIANGYAVSSSAIVKIPIV